MDVDNKESRKLFPHKYLSKGDVESMMQCKHCTEYITFIHR